jgi:hypothetical protein
LFAKYAYRISFIIHISRALAETMLIVDCEHWHNQLSSNNVFEPRRIEQQQQQQRPRKKLRMLPPQSILVDLTKDRVAGFPIEVPRTIELCQRELDRNILAARSSNSNSNNFKLTLDELKGAFHAMQPVGATKRTAEIWSPNEHRSMLSNPRKRLRL